MDWSYADYLWIIVISSLDSFTADDPLVRKWYNATFLQICSHEKANSSTTWMALGWVKCLYILILGELFL